MEVQGITSLEQFKMKKHKYDDPLNMREFPKSVCSIQPTYGVKFKQLDSKASLSSLEEEDIQKREIEVKQEDLEVKPYEQQSTAFEKALSRVAESFDARESPDRGFISGGHYESNPSRLTGKQKLSI